MSEMKIIPVKIGDNYAYVLVSNGVAAVVDPTSAKAVESVLNESGTGLDYIINTHHHADHTAGNPQLQKRYGAEIVSPSDGDTLKIGDSTAKVIGVPGHTMDHIAIWFEAEKALFTGDALFHMGCGRVFEGTHEQMFNSLQKLASLPGDTLVYCGHEYTMNNIAFAESVAPDDEKIREIKEKNSNRLKNDGTTVPFMLSDDTAANPFMRSGCEAFAKALGMSGKTALDVFTAVRMKKDKF